MEGVEGKMLRITPPYCRVMRMMREFPKEKLWRLFWISFVPLILFLIIFIPSYYKITKIEGTNDWTIYEEKPNGFLLIRNIFETSFELTDYHFCFKNINTESYLYVNNSQHLYVDENPDITLILNKGDQEIKQEIIRGEKYCWDVDLKESFSIKWIIGSILNTNESGGENTYIPILTEGWEDTFYPNKFSLLTKFILFLFTYWAFFWLFTRIVVYYRKGIA